MAISTMQYARDEYELCVAGVQGHGFGAWTRMLTGDRDLDRLGATRINQRGTHHLLPPCWIDPEPFLHYAPSDPH